MSFPRYLRIWHGFTKRGTCIRCKGPVLWVVDDRGKAKPFDPQAKALRVEPADERGRIMAVYEPLAFHRCKQTVSARSKAMSESR